MSTGGHDQGRPHRRARKGPFLAELRGPLLTLGTVVAVEYASRTEFPVSVSAAVYLIVVCLVAHGLGPRAGLLSATAAVAYEAYSLSVPGQVLRYAPGNLQQLLLLAATMPAAALLVGLLKGQADRIAAVAEERTHEVAAGQAALTARLREMDALLAIARVVGSTTDLQEALRLICREMARLTGADVAAAHIVDPRRVELRPVAGYHVPEAALPVLSQTVIPLAALGLLRSEVVDAARVVWTDDARQDPRFGSEGFRAFPHQSAAVVPLVLDAEVSGTIYLAWLTERRRFADVDVGVLQTLGQQVGVLLRNARLYEAQAAVAIRNARLYAESSRQAERLETLTRLTRAITASLDQAVILSAVADAATSLFPGGACLLWTVEGERVLMRAQSGIREVGEALPAEGALGEGFAGSVCAGGDPLFLQDVYAHTELVPPEWARAQGFVSAAALPLVVGARRVGAFGLFTRAPHAFDAGEVALLQALAEQGAVALEKARLFQDSQERRRLSEKLYAVAVSMERSMDPNSRLRDFVEGARDALGFDRCNVFLATADGAAVELVAGTDVDPARRALVPLSGGGGGLRAAWEAGETLIVSTDAQLAALAPVPLPVGSHPALRTRRFAVIPLKFRGTPVGLVTVDNKYSRRPITARAVAQLEIFCQQLAQSLSTARLYLETQQRERDATLLFEVTRRLSATLDLNEVLDIVADSTIEALTCDAAGFFGWDPARGGLAFVRGRPLEGDTGRGPVVAAGEGVVGRAYAERRPIFTPDRAADPTVTVSEAKHALLQPVNAFRASLAVPVLIRDQAAGVLVAHHAENHEWTEPETRLFANVAAQAAVAIENARLYTETQHNLAGAALLNEAARTLHRTLDVRRLLPDTLASVGRTFGALGSAVVLFDEGAAHQWPVVHWGAWAEGLARALGEPLRRREAPLLVPDASARPDLIPPGSGPPEPVGFAAFPVRGRSRILAGLVLLFPATRALTEAETRLLAAYADQLAMALDNAALFEEAENKRTQLEQVFASTSDGFLVLDLEGRIVGLNRQGGDLLGVHVEEVVGRPLALALERLGPALAPGESGAPALRALVETGTRPLAGDLALASPTRRTLRWQATPMRDLLGGTVGATVTLRDVTREREIDRMKTEFVSTVSHELRTPLTSIKGSLHLLLSDPSLALDEVQRQLVDISLRNTDRLIRLINDILDISKIEAGQIQLKREPHRVGEFVEAAAEGIAAFAESRGIVVERRVPEDLPPVSVDLDRMVQVVTNLLSNAVKFSPAGSRVTLSAVRAAGELTLSVTDRGRGIAPADMDRLFQKFQQLDSSAAREAGGTGLGLAICRGIVEEHGGRIAVESRLGEGATFTIWLPLPAEAAAPPAPGEAQPPQAPLILVVDDEPALREAIREQLEMGGFRVIAAGRALEAVEVARQRRPDLVTMDLMLPDLDGLEAVRLMREHPETRETPVVMVTAIELDGSRFGPEGPVACITKPFTITTLLDTVRAHLKSARGGAP